MLTPIPWLGSLGPSRPMGIGITLFELLLAGLHRYVVYGRKPPKFSRSRYGIWGIIRGRTS